MKLRTLLLAAVACFGSAALVVQAQVPGVNSTLNAAFALAYDNDTMMPTYSHTGVFVPLATGLTTTDVCGIVGSATKTIKVRRVLLNLVATTAISDPVAVIKRSTADTGGTSVSYTPVPYDSSNGAATAVASVWTANPTVGTAVGLVADPFVSVGNLTTGGAQVQPQVLFRSVAQPIVLRGVAEGVYVNFNSYQYSGGLASCTIEWTEQ